MKRRVPAYAVAALLVAGSLAPSLARADGDPASDVLLSQPAFVPADAGFSAQQQSSLSMLLETSAKAGFPLRVAIIPEAYDLGYVTQLWGKPRSYAEFLGVELSLVFKGPLLVVMPAGGFGFYWPGHTSAPAYAALAHLAPPRSGGGAGLLATTENAARTLADAAGVELATPSSTAAPGDTARSGTGGRSLAAPIAGLVVLAMLLALGVAALRRRSRSRADRARESSAPRPVPSWVRFAVPALVLLAAGDVALLALGPTSRRSHAAVSASTALADAGPSGPESESEGVPMTLPGGARPAPSFSLSDQDGDPVSPASYRGRPLIITFIDPLCRELCPLAARVLSKVGRELPPSERPEVLAVSVNIYGDARANLLEDFSKWGLTSQWHWAVGSPRELAAVWKRYYAEVDVTTKRIAGTTVHYLTHSEMAYVIDAKGDERYLFLWPYGAARVEAAIRSLYRA